MDGMELLAKLKEEYILVPKIIITSVHPEESIKYELKKLNLRVNNILPKPYTPFKLYETIINKSVINSLDNESVGFTPTIRLLETKKALIAEDSETNQIILKNLLENIGFKVTLAKDGIEALEHFYKSNYDIVFMDIQMPLMDGFKASEKIRETDTKVIIFVFSATLNSFDINKAKKIEINEYLLKPIDKKVLNNSIEKYFKTSTPPTKSIYYTNHIYIGGGNRYYKYDT